MSRNGARKCAPTLLQQGSKCARVGIRLPALKATHVPLEAALSEEGQAHGGAILCSIYAGSNFMARASVGESIPWARATHGSSRSRTHCRCCHRVRAGVNGTPTRIRSAASGSRPAHPHCSGAHSVQPLAKLVRSSPLMSQPLPSRGARDLGCPVVRVGACNVWTSLTSLATESCLWRTNCATYRINWL